jgi:hypothetical protein
MTGMLGGLLLAYFIAKALHSPWSMPIGFAFLLSLVVVAVAA